MWRWPIPTALIIVAAGCSGADSGPVFTADEVSSPTPAPTTQLIVPLTTVPPINTSPTTAPANTVPANTVPSGVVPSGVVLDRLTVLGGNVVEIIGTGGASTDEVTIDGAVAAFLTFERSPDGTFVATVPIDTPGNYTVCVATTCDTVLVAAANE